MTALGEAALMRLNALARLRGIAPQSLAISWIGERFLHRLAASRSAESMVLKGGHLFGVWDGDARRPTADVDLGLQQEIAAADLVAVLRDIASVELTDGVRFEAEGITVESSFSGRPKGTRAVVPAVVGRTAVRLKVDVTFGQPVTPGPELRWHHGLISELPPARLACAPAETMVAEKLAIAVEFGADNTRIRDYHDLWHVSRRRSFSGPIAQLAIRRTFEARSAGGFLAREDGYWSGGFTPAFATPPRMRAWRGYCAEHARGQSLPEFDDIVEQVSAFAIPLLRSVRDERRLGGWSPAERRWRAPKDLRGSAR